MKKMAWTTASVLLISLGSWTETRDKHPYANTSFIVWQLEKGAGEASRRIDTPIPEVFRESWLYEYLSFDLSGKSSATKVVEKEGFRFVLIAESTEKLTIQVKDKSEELFRIILCRPSSIKAIFYGRESQAYLIEVFYTVDSHPSGLLSPGIKK